MAKIVKRATIKRGNVTTVYRNTEGRGPESNPYLMKKSIKDLKQRPVKKSPKKIGSI